MQDIVAVVVIKMCIFFMKLYQLYILTYTLKSVITVTMEKSYCSYLFQLRKLKKINCVALLVLVLLFSK